MPNERYDFSQVPAAAVAEFYRQGELYLDNLVKIGLAADARATTSSNIFGAAAVGSGAVAANLANADKPHVAMIFGVLAVTTYFFVAAVLCAIAARPKVFFHPGHQPDLLYPAAVSEEHIKRTVAEEIQMRIDKNLASLQSAATQLSWGQNIAILAPIAFLSTYLSISHLGL